MSCELDLILARHVAGNWLLRYAAVLSNAPSGGLQVCPFPPSRVGCMAQARTRSATLDGVLSETRLSKKLAFRMRPDPVPPSGVDAGLSHLKYPSNVFGFAIDPSQPAENQL